MAISKVASSTRTTAALAKRQLLLVLVLSVSLFPSGAYGWVTALFPRTSSLLSQNGARDMTWLSASRRPPQSRQVVSAWLSPSWSATALNRHTTTTAMTPLVSGTTTLSMQQSASISSLHRPLGNHGFCRPSLTSLSSSFHDNYGQEDAQDEEDPLLLSDMNRRTRAPFEMPLGSPDDSSSSSVVAADNNGSGGNTNLAWNSLGLWTELVDVLVGELDCPTPTAVQQLVIPELLKSKVGHTTFVAATGSGKTLAYTLPVLQQLKQAEVFPTGDSGSKKKTGGTAHGIDDEFTLADATPLLRRPKRPRALILAPTRELAEQIVGVVKKLCHSIKLSSQLVVGGGEDYGKQRNKLNRPVDVLVATPGRLLKHWKEQNVFLGQLQMVVLDEMDTLLEQGFAPELRQLLYPILYHKQAEQEIVVQRDLQPTAPTIVMTSATITKAIQKMMDQSKTTQNDPDIQAKKHYIKPVAVDGDGSSLNKKDKRPVRGLVLPQMHMLKAAGLHKSVPRLQQVFVDVGSGDKISILVDIVEDIYRRNSNRPKQDDDPNLTMVFCNTAGSCRACQYALEEAQIPSLSYHGELNSIARSENLRRFRQGEIPLLVCTDLAARGLDVPNVDQVVMFDFPLNALDYLHRSGRTARGTSGRGRVTALIAKRDQVLAQAIQKAVQEGRPIDGLSSRKSDYRNSNIRLGNSSGGGRRGSPGSRRRSSSPARRSGSPSRSKTRRSSNKSRAASRR